jgi:hypothetical protein
VGEDIFYIRHPDETYSSSTAAHIGHALDAVRGKRVLRCRGERARGTHRPGAIMSEPDWEWLRWCRFFEREMDGHWHPQTNRTNPELTVVVMPEIKFPGDSLMTQARDKQVPFTLTRFCETAAGFATGKFPYKKCIEHLTLIGDIRIRQVRRRNWECQNRNINLNHLLRVNPDTPTSVVLAAEHRKIPPAPAWRWRLFWEYDAEDPRKALDLWPNAVDADAEIPGAT